MHLKRLRYIKSDILSYVSIAMMMFAAFASLWSDGANLVGLYVSLPIAFVLSTLQNRGFRFNTYEKTLYSLFIWDVIAYLWADDKELASREQHVLLGAFLISYVASIQARNIKHIPYLYIVWCLLYLSAWNYALHHILVFMTNATDRLNDEKLNANTLAYYTFFFSFIAFMLSEIWRKKLWRRIWTIIFWGMLPASFGVAILTASRQVLIVQLPLYAILIYIRFIKNVSIKHKLAFCFVLIIILIAASGPISDTYDNSFLKQRSEKSLAEDSRATLIKNALTIGTANLPLGVGSNNFMKLSDTGEFAHNSYLEAYADMGIIGVALYIALMVIYTFRQWKRYRNSHDKMYFLFFTFGAIYMLDSIFFVFYNAVWLISFFMLVAAHSESYYKAQTNNIELHVSNS